MEEEQMPKILMIVSSAGQMTLADGSPYPTGVWAEELYKPLKRFEAARVEVAIATPDGKPPVLDPYSLESKFHYPDEDEDFLHSVTRSFATDPEDVRLTLDQITTLDLAAARRIFQHLQDRGLNRGEARRAIDQGAKKSWRENRNYIDVLLEDPAVARATDRSKLAACRDALMADSEAQAQNIKRELSADPRFQKPITISKLSNADAAAYDAVFMPGGHGPMVDLANNGEVGRVIEAVHSKGKTVAALCHGPAALMSTQKRNSDGGWLFEGYKMTVFTDEEEYQTKPGKRGMPWRLEGEIKNFGGIVDTAGTEWISHVVVDRNLITGQNPASAEATADAVLKRLGVLEVRKTA
jgi:putative intracellular protease/amidase